MAADRTSPAGDPTGGAPLITDRRFDRRRIPPEAGVWLAGVVLALFLGLLAWRARSWAAPLVVIAVLLVGAYYWRVLGLQAGTVVLLIVTSIEDRFTFPVGPVSLRAEQVAVLLACAVLVAGIMRRPRKELLRPSLAEGLLLAWFALGLLSSLLGSPDLRLSAKNLALLAVTFVVVFLPRRLLTGPRPEKHLETMVRWLLIAFATEAGYGTLVYLIHILGPTISISPNPASGYLSAYGTLWEQNVFGAYCAAGLVAWAYLGPRRFRRAWLGLALCLGGLADSLTRAAWIAAATIGALGLILPSLRRRLDLNVLARGAAAGLVLVAATLAVDRSGRYSEPLHQVVGGAPSGHVAIGFMAAILNRVDLLGRLNQFGVVWGDLRGHLFLGRGTASFEFLHQFGGIPEHIASLPLLILEDTGLAGVVVFAAFGVALFLKVRSRRDTELVAALGQVALVIVIANLATQTTELMVDWLLIGLLLAVAELLPERGSNRGLEGSAAPGSA
jgi:hypothetical protein